MAVSAVLSPYHLINNAGIALNYLYDLIAYILIGIIRHGSSEVAVFIHLDGNIDCLKQPGLVDPRKDKAGFIERLVCRLPGRDARRL